MNQKSKAQLPQENSENQIKNAYILRFVTIFLLTLPYMIYRIAYYGVQSTCLIDNLHELTLPINKAIQSSAWRYIIGIGQILTDLWVFTIIFYWILNSQNFRLPTVIAFAYGLREIYMKILKFPFPQNLIWKNPGFFSFTVPYDHTRDFFYSGHTTTITIAMLQLWLCSSYPLAIFSTFSFVYICSMLIIVRVHYCIDVIAAIIYCIFIHNLIKKNIYYVDKFWSAPYSLALFIYRKIFGDKKIQQNSTSMIEDENEFQKK